MTNILKTGSDWLENQRTAHCSGPAVFTRGADEIDITGSLGKAQYNLTDSTGMTVESTIIDLIVLVADLVIDDEPIFPQPGDKITIETIDYEVLDLPGEGCWRWSDSFNKALRIHLKRITAQ